VRNDAYYKKVTNPIDDGQFGAGLCPDRLQLCGENVGVELSAKYKRLRQSGLGRSKKGPT
jgi:hypothetical protein